MKAAADTLARYRTKRNFGITPEPSGTPADTAPQLSYVIQKHWASRLHYDFRLEWGGVLLSWAVPKGPSFDPKDKRMAVHVEDHPVSYGGFEGTIPPKQYGAGTVIVWDNGTWEPVGDVPQSMAQGKLVFRLHGQKLAGLWELVRIAKPGDRQDPWILFKKRDAWARPTSDYDVIAALPDSVVTAPLGPVEEREPRGEAAESPAAAPAAPDLSRARKAPLPAKLAPQLATASSVPPSGPGWALEPKWDGYRILARVDGDDVQLHTRKHNDWTTKLKSLAAEIRKLGIGTAWLDGEIVVLGDDGAPQFNALQNAMDGGGSQHIVYFVFDLPYFEGRDLRAVPWTARRAVLKELLERRPSERIRFSPDFDVPVAQLLAAAKQMRLEGIVAKRIDAPYADGTRSEQWLKLKGSNRQEFVVLGFADRAGSTGEVGSLLLGYHDADGKLQYAGNTGTGWDQRTSRQLHAQLVKLEVQRPPVDPADVKPGRWSRRTAGQERWVKPERVVEVEFAEWTPENHVRHASFKGLRADKPAAEVVREATASMPAAQAGPAAKGAAPAAAGSVRGIRISHGERVIDPSSGLTKLQLARYYDGIAERMLPHLKGRPVSLVRAPDGITGELFFQKHPETRIHGVPALDPALWPGHAALLHIDGADALVSAAQMNTVEFHTWNSTVRHIGKPDRLIFDLDPGEGVAWKAVQEAATLTRAMLEALGLACWLKTSGGKGLHVVVPIAPKLDDDAVKAFSQAVVQHMAKTIPGKLVAKSGPANRIGKVYVDYLRNGRAQTTAAAFSARARPGMGVSMPVAWEQLASLKSGDQWTIATAREYLSFESQDPWAGYWKSRQTLTKAMKALGR